MIAGCGLPRRGGSIEKLVWQFPSLSINNRQSKIGNRGDAGPNEGRRDSP
jgi:hypothetical protein